MWAPETKGESLSETAAGLPALTCFLLRPR